jgi:transposase
VSVGLTVQEIATKLEWSVATVRRWIWFCRIRPTGRRPKWVPSSRGQRKVVMNTYDTKVTERLRQAHERGT